MTSLLFDNLHGKFACKDAPRSFRYMSRATLSLSVVLTEAEETFSGLNLPVMVQEGLKIGNGRRGVLEDPQSYLSIRKSRETNQVNLGSVGMLF